jgi:hypothetical protein
VHRSVEQSSASFSAHFRPLRFNPSTSPAVSTSERQRKANASVPVDAVATTPSPNRGKPREILENFMFAYILEKLGNWFERSEQRRLEDYLAGSADLPEIERRLRRLEKSGYPG